MKKEVKLAKIGDPEKDSPLYECGFKDGYDRGLLDAITILRDGGVK